MGNTFSRNKSLTQILITLDTKIGNTERRLVNIQKCKQKTLNYFYLGTLVITPIILSFFYFENFSKADYVILFSILVLFRMTVGLVFRIFTNRYEGKLTKLIELQKVNIEKLKQQEKYKETKNIIDKYEKPSKIDKNRKVVNKDLLDTLADVVLGNEDEMFALICSKCFAHNGMIHPSQISLEKFSCCRCEQITLLKKQNNENCEMIDE